MGRGRGEGEEAAQKGMDRRNTQPAEEGMGAEQTQKGVQGCANSRVGLEARLAAYSVQ